MPYYAVHIPTKGVGGPPNAGSGATSSPSGGPAAATGPAASADNNSDAAPFVFREKCEALDILKTSKDARLREFASEDDALKYAQTGYELLATKYADVRTSTAAVEKAAFRMPTKQEFIEFRKLIETDNYKRVKSIIWENPRYLVSSGDTPTTLKEGYRYNAMHVCAISKRPRIAELILQTVSDPKFVDLVLGKRADEKTCKEMCCNLLDYYLNIPEKGRSETPLHLSAKFGVLEMVEVLTSYPQCKMTPNNDGSLPKDIVCSRDAHASPELIKKIQELLEERFYVPVLRSADSAIPPHIGEPFSQNNPPHLNKDPMAPEVKIEALAGPMNKDDAKKFHRRWKTPPRIGSTVSSPLSSNHFVSPRKPRSNVSLTPSREGATAAHGGFSTPKVQRRALFNSTPIKGDNVERDKQNGNHVPGGEEEDEATEGQEKKAAGEGEASEGEEIANNNNNNNIQEVTVAKAGPPPPMSMLKSVLNPKTPLRRHAAAFLTYREQAAAASPLPLSESGANDSFGSNLMSVSRCHDTSQLSLSLCDTPGYKERHVKITDTEKGLELIGRELAKQQNIGWREYWDFLDTFVDIASADGLAKLEAYFAGRLKEAEATKRASIHSMEMLDNVCHALEKLEFAKVEPPGAAGDAATGSATSGSSAGPPQSATPYTCVEKSLQVFAKRMTKTIIHNIDNVVSINDSLLSELKRLKSLIYSFREDARFVNVAFGRVHSRIGNLIAIYLENSQEVTPVVKLKVFGVIQKLLQTPGERRDHIQCLCGRIKHQMESPVQQILPENLKTEEMCSRMWRDELECHCQWETNLSRKTSRRNRMEARHKSAERKQKAAARAAAATTTRVPNEYRSPAPATGHDSSDEEFFWTDNGGSDSEESAEERWFTPAQSPSRLSFILADDDDEAGGDKPNKLFVYGTEPTKRDLDVLNAIFHIDLDREKYPNIHSWKKTLLGFRSEEMDYFPSPAVVRKTTSFTVTQLSASANKENIFKQLPSAEQRQQHSPSPASLTTKQLPITGKRLFATPKLSKVAQATVTKKPPQPSALSLPPAGGGGGSTSMPQALSTPLNKIRGLFSAYRERFDNSPKPSLMDESSGGDSGPELSSPPTPLHVTAATAATE